MVLFKKGRADYLRNDYGNAAVYLQQALDLEKQKASLPRDYWRVLVDNLADSYGLSGDHRRAREVSEYGISQDPMYPNFHYTLACAYADTDDLDHALGELSQAFKDQANLLPGELMPDPRNDASFRRFRNDKQFQSLMVSLYPRETTHPVAESSPPQSYSPDHSERPRASQRQFANAVPAGQPKPTLPKVPPGRRICFIPLAEFPAAEIVELAAYYRRKFKLENEILPSISIPENAIDYRRRQLVAETLVAGLHHARPELARDSGAIVIGFTDRDIYPLGEDWRFAFGWRDGNADVAVVSTARMDLHYRGEPPEEARLEVRLRKIVTKDIGILYYGLPQNSNPRSVLYDGILGIQELDAVGEDF